MGRDRREDEGQYYPGGKTIPVTPQHGGGSVVLDDTVTQNSQNGVKSSGIWSWVKSLLPAWLTPGYAEPATVASVENKVDKVPGKGLSSNDYTTAEKTKLAGVEAGAQVNPTPVAPSPEIAEGAFGDAKLIAEFVNSSINNLAAFYLTKDAQGNAFPTKAALDAATTFYNGGVARSPTKNDYLIVLADEEHTTALGVDPTTRYVYDGAQWAFQYVVNNNSLTQAQVNAVNSGITAALVLWLSAFRGGDTATTLASVLTTLASIDAKTDGKLDKSGGTMTGPLVIQNSDGSEMEIGFGGFTLWYGPNRLIRRDLSFPNLVNRPTTDTIVATHDLIEALPYRLNMSATIVDRAINVVTSGAFVIPEGFKDLLIRYTGTPTSLTFSGTDASITDWGDDLPTDSGDYLITVSRIAADEAYIRIINLEARA